MFVSRLRGDGVDPMASASRCSPTTTAPTAPGPPRCSRPLSSGSPGGGRRWRGGRSGRRRLRWRAYRERLSDDLDSPAALAAVDRWADETSRAAAAIWRRLR